MFVLQKVSRLRVLLEMAKGYWGEFNVSFIPASGRGFRVSDDTLDRLLNVRYEQKITKRRSVAFKVANMRYERD